MSKHNQPELLRSTNDHLTALMRLSILAGWNQTTDDWRFMLRAGCGWGISTDGTPAGLIASTIVLPYLPTISWISMVLVDPEHRRQGLATALLDVALDDLQQRGLNAVLDATADGQAVYQRLGFSADMSYTRYLLQPDGATDLQVAKQSNQDIHIRELRPGDCSDVLSMDNQTFGASRGLLLQHLIERSPDSAYVAEVNGMLGGFVLGRDGSRAHQIGPLIARDTQIASMLLSQALSVRDESVLVDLCDEHTDVQQLLLRAGFSSQRNFRRMSLNTKNDEDDDTPSSKGERSLELGALTYLVAGPELG